MHAGSLVPQLGSGGRRSAGEPLTHAVPAAGVAHSHPRTTSPSPSPQQQHHTAGETEDTVAAALAISRNFFLTAAPLLVDIQAAKAAQKQREQQEQLPDQSSRSASRRPSPPPTKYFVAGDQHSVSSSQNSRLSSATRAARHQAHVVRASDAAPEAKAAALRRTYEQFEEKYAARVERLQRNALMERQRQQEKFMAATRRAHWGDGADSSDDEEDAKRRKKNAGQQQAAAAGAGAANNKRGNKAGATPPPLPSYARARNPLKRRNRGGANSEAAEQEAARQKQEQLLLQQQQEAAEQKRKQEEAAAAAAAAATPRTGGRAGRSFDDDEEDAASKKAKLRSTTGPKADPSMPPVCKDYMKLLAHYQPEQIRRVYGADRDEADRERSRFLNSTTLQFASVSQAVANVVLREQLASSSARGGGAAAATTTTAADAASGSMSASRMNNSVFLTPRPPQASPVASSSGVLSPKQQHQQQQRGATPLLPQPPPPAELRRLLGGGVPPPRCEVERRHEHESDVRMRAMQAVRLKREMLLTEREERPRSLAATSSEIGLQTLFLVPEIPDAVPDTNGGGVNWAGQHVPLATFPASAPQRRLVERHANRLRARAFVTAMCAAAFAARLREHCFPTPEEIERRRRRETRLEAARQVLRAFLLMARFKLYRRRQWRLRQLQEAQEGGEDDNAHDAVDKALLLKM